MSSDFRPSDETPEPEHPNADEVEVRGTAWLRRRFDGWEVLQDRYERWLSSRGL